MSKAAFMRLQDPDRLAPGLRGGVVAIGNFDGVHRGHQVVLQRALDEARRHGCAALALTFEPHPRSVFRPTDPVFRLTPAPVRARILERMGFDAVVEQPFDKAFAQQSAEDFIARILDGGLGVAHAVTGFNFHFGRNREGGPDYLAQSGKRHGFDVTLVDALRDDSGEIVSSSRIRSALETGDVDTASMLLGYRYMVEAEVVRGKALGRTIGYPTANMRLEPSNGLAHGIYAVRFRRADGSLHDGVASFGRRPTVDEAGEALLETYLFDGSPDLYGEVASVSLFARLRGEEKFDSLDALVDQMKRDEAQARAILAEATPLTPLDRALTFAGAP